jgi:hypothetical protein
MSSKETNQKSPMYRRKEDPKNIIQFDSAGYPFCEKHGAMNCVSKDRVLWRCFACGVGVSFGSVPSFDIWLDCHRLREKK